MKSPKLHYFDYNATHPPLDTILTEALKDYHSEFSNPSGATRFSLKNQGKIEEARQFFMANDGFPMDGHIFSSTGTEANYIMIAALRKKFPDTKEIYTSGFEHSSMYSALEYFGFHPILIHSQPSGEIDLDDLREKMTDTTLPISIIYAANETGVIQPMDEIFKIAKSYNMPIVSDCMQAFGKIFIDYKLLDGYTCSGHKIGAGIGSALTGLQASLKSDSLGFIQGGNQENGFRAGTENVFAILCFHRSAEYQINQLGGVLFDNLTKQMRIQEKLLELNCEIIGINAHRLPNTHFTILPIDDLDFFMMGMEERNIQISTGSSCKSRAREASPALLRMGYSEEQALRAIRISWGSLTSQDDVEVLLSSFEEVLDFL
ncbi:MAG: aminotransferase class V-fold PLP-dependent enzyme [Leptospira sp.]|nr:aminotransferase class V-fold PLP-dependent enzyme [Leptospira sp.]